MPIYEYRCHACDKVQEILQKVNEATPEVCPVCGKSNSLEKLISHTSFQLKGGGWYKDLYSSAKAPAAAAPAPDKTS